MICVLGSHVCRALVNHRRTVCTFSKGMQASRLMVGKVTWAVLWARLEIGSAIKAALSNSRNVVYSEALRALSRNCIACGFVWRRDIVRWGGGCGFVESRVCGAEHAGSNPARSSGRIIGWAHISKQEMALLGERMLEDSRCLPRAPFNGVEGGDAAAYAVVL